MKQVSLSPIRKYTGQADDRPLDQAKLLSQRLDQSITLISQKDQLQNASLDK